LFVRKFSPLDDAGKSNMATMKSFLQKKNNEVTRKGNMHLFRGTEEESHING